MDDEEDLTLGLVSNENLIAVRIMEDGHLVVAYLPPGPAKRFAQKMNDWADGRIKAIMEDDD